MQVLCFLIQIHNDKYDRDDYSQAHSLSVVFDFHQLPFCSKLDTDEWKEKWKKKKLISKI